MALIPKLELKQSQSLVMTPQLMQAIKLLPLESFDLVITDINMPDINGLELVSFVRKNPAYSGLPIMIVSTEGSERDRERGLSLGADAYMVKPFEAEELRDVVCGLLDRSASEGGA